MRYTEESENAVKIRANCYEVISEYLKLQPSGSGYVGLCCFHNERTGSFHIDSNKNIYKCFGCGAVGDSLSFLMNNPNLKMSYRDALQKLATKYNIQLEEELDTSIKVYTKPVWRNNTELDNGIVQWFEARSIKQKTLIDMKVTSGVESMYQKSGQWQNMLTIQFNYFRKGELINIKYRDENKSMKLAKGSELIFYNLDSLIGAKECYITEGEPDCLAMIQCGYLSCLSVPNGANINSNNLTYVDNCFDDFASIEKIYIAVDNDIAGRKLREDLAERFGKDRCVYIEWGDKKDANEILMAYGIEGVHKCCGNAKEFELEGVFTISHYNDEIDDMYVRGLDRGVDFNIQGFNVRFVPGYLWGITGIPGHGKSEGVDELTAQLIRQGIYGAYYSPENKPTKLHFSKMASRFVGKAWDGPNKMTKKEKDEAKAYLDKKVWFIHPEKDFSIDSILGLVLNLIKRHGIKWFVIDAWNTLEHKGDNDKFYIGKVLTKIATFCILNNVTCFLVAHPTKMEKDKKDQLKVPGAYDISGSADFNNKLDVILSYYLNHDASGKPLDVDWHRQKVKFKHWGWKGVSSYKYDMDSGRYYVDGCMDHKNWITGEMNVERINEVVNNSLNDVGTVVTNNNSIGSHDDDF